MNDKIAIPINGKHNKMNNPEKRGETNYVADYQFSSVDDHEISPEFIAMHRRIEYGGICNADEVERIMNPNSGSDYLLKLRAETLLDEIRLERVYRNKIRIKGRDAWSLDSSFISIHFSEYMKKLSIRDRTVCERIVCGNIFSREPNGEIFTTEFGPIITISESLLFFLKFMHLAVLDFNVDIPEYVRLNALKIAIRVMLRTETMDFLMDPRGILPVEVGKKMHDPLLGELMFIAGHEYSHFLLGHLSSHQTTSLSIRQESHYAVFSNTEKDEFCADVKSISNVINRNHDRSNLLNSSLLWFGCLAIYEAAQDFMSPTGPLHLRSHPPAINRYDNLLEEFKTLKGLNKNKWSKFKETIYKFRDYLTDDLATDMESYEFYGSVYLDAPNTEWRGKELIDRVDYY